MYLDLESGIVRTKMNLKLFGAIWNLRVETGLEIRFIVVFGLGFQWVGGCC